MKSLNKRYKVSNAEEKEGIKEITSSLRERLKRLRRVEGTRKLRKQREKRRAQFIKDPYNFTRSLLGGARSGSLSSPKEEVEAFLKETHGDPYSGLELNENPEVGTADHPSIVFNANEPTWKEIQEVVKKARAASAPGPSGIPYRVYKKCPKIFSATSGSCLKGSGRKGLYHRSGRRLKAALFLKRKAQCVLANSELSLCSARSVRSSSQ